MTELPADDARRKEFEAAAIPFLTATYNFGLRLTRRPEDARDLVQETYLRAYRTFGNFQQGTNCRAWLFTILYSVFVNRYRKERREPKSVSVEELEERFHQVLTADEPAGTASWTDPEIESALADLPETFRSAVLLVDVEDLTYEEAAAAMDCPVGTLRSRLFRGRKLLYTALQAEARRLGYPKASSEE